MNRPGRHMRRGARLPGLVATFVVVLAACAADSADTGPTTTVTSAAVPSTTTAPTIPAESTSTVALAPEPVPPAEIAGTLGFVGCSMSRNSVEGYETLGGTNMWSRRAPYGGGAIGRWFLDLTGERGRYWEGFDAELEAHPDTAALWLNICTIRQNRLDSFESTAAVIAEISKRIPGVSIYVSAQPTYTNGHLCGLAGRGGPEAMTDLAAEIVDAGLAMPGPTMGPLTAAQTSDGCHANENGQQVLGQQLLDFFG